MDKSDFINFIIRNFGGKVFGKIKPIGVLYDRIVSNMLPKYVNVNGMDIFLHKDDKGISRELWLNKTYEPMQTEMTKKIVKKGMVVADIGANLGYYTLLLSKLVGKNGIVYSFEPSKINFELLKKSVIKNNCKNVILFNSAVSDRIGKHKLFIYPKIFGGNTFAMTTENYQVVDTINIDSLNKSFDFIKMDINGGENLAIEGMKETIRKSKNLKMFIEFSPRNEIILGFNPAEFLSNLSKDFKITPIDSIFQNLFCERRK